MYGARRTGTNYFQILLDRNFDVKVLPTGLGHKHKPPYDRIFNLLDKNIPIDCGHGHITRDNLRFVVCIKNPYAWMYSLIRYAKKSNSEIAKPQEYNKFLKHWIDIYNRKNQAWFDFCKKYSQYSYPIIWENTLIGSTQNVLSNIHKKFGLVRSRDDWFDLNRQIEPGETIKKYDFRRDFYKKKEYVGALSDMTKKFLREEINWRLVSNIASLFGDKSIEGYYDHLV